MTPKEKAKDLVSKMQSNLYSDGHYDAKQCALIAVDEMIEVLDKMDWTFLDQKEDYFREVKQEIEKL